MAQRVQCSNLTGTVQEFKRAREWVYRFLARNKLSIRRITRSVSLSDMELLRRSNAFLDAVDHQLLLRPDIVFLNMDQTSIEPDSVPKSTVDLRGAKSIASRKSTLPTSRITALLAVCSTGDKLPPLLVFKGRPGGRVHREVRRLAADFSNQVACTVQANAWTNEAVMIDWVEK